MKTTRFFLSMAIATCFLAPAFAGNGAGGGAVDEFTSRVVLGQGTSINFYATNAAAGATTVETAITLTKSAGTGATSSAASFVVTSGKRFRITSISIATLGNAVATAQRTTFSLRLNTAGAVTTSSTPVLFQVTSATVATASAWDRSIYHFPDGFEILGDGTLQIGVTAVSTFTTNAPTWFINITGYEY